MKTLRHFLILTVMVCLVALCLFLPGRQENPAPIPTEPPVVSTAPTQSTVTEPSTVPTEPPVTKVSTATIGTTGDILLHDLVIQSGYHNGSYNYDNIFRYFAAYASQVDYAVANLEVTLAGNGQYAGYPCFNSPDAIVDALKAAGFDMLLTANNHSYDTGHAGFLRTQQVIADRALAHIGTRPSEDAPAWILPEINGIRVGMICYTYNTGLDADGAISLNGTPLSAGDSRLINSFHYDHLDRFYETLSAQLQQMRSAGAEATMLFIHWGEEYEIYANRIQKEMAQQLCDLGIDVIVGNHAHVIQPIELLTSSTDESKKTLCLYSTGNAVSNIYETSTFPVHTEDGMLFTVSFAKYSDGTVLLEGAQVLPTWVHRRWDENLDKRMFEILPLGDDSAQWQQEMGLTDAIFQRCVDSHRRTMAIVGEGLTRANAYYAANQQAIETQLGVEN